MDQLTALGLVALAAVLGGLVGWERERSAKPAGLRTHMLVAAGAALVVLVGRHAFDAAGGETGDPNRALHAVITGIGFLGAGTILRDRSTQDVTGLTTAASMLLAAAVGVATGFGQLVLAVGVTVLLVVVLWAVGRVEPWLMRRLGHHATGDEDPGPDASDAVDQDAADHDPRDHAPHRRDERSPA